MIPGLICLMLSLLPLILLLCKGESRWRPSTWIVLTGMLGIIAVLFSISIGRVNFGQPKSSRYAEIAFLLIPYTALAWWLVLNSKTGKVAVLCLLWAVCLISFSDTWSLQVYRETKQTDLYVLESFEDTSDAVEKNILSGRMAPDFMRRARELNVRFVRRIPAGPSENRGE
jgi:hypothetical protein